MRVLIVAVASESSGAQTILEETYEDAKAWPDKSVHWIFLLGTLYLPETDCISIINLPWVKKSRLHRLFFDMVYAPFLARRNRIDAVLSLQNTVIPFVRVPQALNVHQSLPFAEHRFTFFEDRHLWIHQNIIGLFVIRAIKKADFVFFPTLWVRRACIARTGADPAKIEVVPPRVKVEVRGKFTPSEEHRRTFFYPASGFAYKNHRTIIEACKILQKKQMPPFRVLFTLQGDETQETRDLAECSKSMNLPVEFIGSISKAQVYEYYTQTVLLFPSSIEAFGLPLLESRLHGGIILASDTPFAREILEGYGNAHFFSTFDAYALASLMERSITGELPYTDVPKKSELKYINQSVLERFIELITCTTGNSLSVGRRKDELLNRHRYR